MAYTLEAFVTGPAAAAVLAEGLGARPVALEQGLQLVPLLDADPSLEPSSFPSLRRLSGRAEALAVRASRRGPVVYLEAEYFGGAGEQQAVLWEDGSARLVGSELPGAVNETLRALGAVRLLSPLAHALQDEFDSVGLGRHRTTQEWTA